MGVGVLTSGKLEKLRVCWALALTTKVTRQRVKQAVAIRDFILLFLRGEVKVGAR
jgi:hypothetical protein